jgi:hypothetical protein
MSQLPVKSREIRWKIEKFASGGFAIIRKFGHYIDLLQCVSDTVTFPSVRRSPLLTSRLAPPVTLTNIRVDMRQ